MSNELAAAIEEAWERRADITPADQDVRGIVDEAVGLLDSGEARVASPNDDGSWSVNQWLKKAVLLSFRVHHNRIIEHGSAGAAAFDKVPSKFAG